MNNDTLNRIISNMVTLQGAAAKREYQQLCFRTLSVYERAAVNQAIRQRTNEAKIVKLNWN